MLFRGVSAFSGAKATSVQDLYGRADGAGGANNFAFVAVYSYLCRLCLQRVST